MSLQEPFYFKPPQSPCTNNSFYIQANIDCKSNKGWTYKKYFLSKNFKNYLLYSTRIQEHLRDQGNNRLALLKLQLTMPQLHRTEQQMHCAPKRTSEVHTSAQTPVPRKRKCLHTEFRQTVRGVSQQAAGPCQNLPRDTGQLLGFLITSPVNGNRTSLTNPHCQHWGSPAWTSLLLPGTTAP